MIRLNCLYAARNFGAHREFLFMPRGRGLVTLKGSMPRPKAHYSMVLRNHQTEGRLKLELIDLPLATAKRFRVRVNGSWARKIPVASKTEVMRQLRACLVSR
jgi:hypothetical protein